MDSANSFTGPVHVVSTMQRLQAHSTQYFPKVTGAQDLPFCDRDCYAVPQDSKYPNIPAYVKELYPAVNDFTTYIPANTG